MTVAAERLPTPSTATGQGSLGLPNRLLRASCVQGAGTGPRQTFSLLWWSLQSEQGEVMK